MFIVSQLNVLLMVNITTDKVCNLNFNLKIMKHLLSLLILLISTTVLKSQEIHTLYSIPSEKIAEGLTVNNLSSINSSKLDYCPIPFGGGIIFTSNRTENLPWYKRMFSKVYSNLLFTAKAKTGKDKYTKPFSLPGEINGKFNEGAASISADGSKMFFTRNATKRNKKGLYDLNIYSAQLIDNKWQNVKEVDLGASEFTNCHPAISVDGQTLYFASNRPGGFGGMDIYATHLEAGKWQTPINLGAAVNSEKTELFPQIGLEGEIYFSSDVDNGVGQLDIWVSRIGASGTLMAKQNMGAPINSTEDDFSFIILPDSRTGYLTSNRKNGIGGDDIYSWEVTLPKEIENEVTPMEEEILTSIDIINNNNESLNAAQLTLVEISYDLVDVPSLNQPFFITNNLDQSLIDMIGERVVPVSGETPKALYPINPARQYFLVADHTNYKATQQVVSGASLIQDKSYALQLMPINEDYLVLASNTPRINSEDGPTSPNLNMLNPADLPTVAVATEENTPVILLAAVPPDSDEEFTEKGGVILETDKAEVAEKAYFPLFSSIYYAFNKYILNPQTKEELSDVVSTLRREISTTVLIESHTDSRGNAEYNNTLSQQRANEVKSYLMENGIASSRITSVGYGSSRPLVECFGENECSEEVHQKNRRTEIILTRPDN